MLRRGVPVPAGEHAGCALVRPTAAAWGLHTWLTPVKRRGTAAAAHNQPHGSELPQQGNQSSSPALSGPAGVPGGSQRRRRGLRQVNHSGVDSSGHQPQQQQPQPQQQRQKQQQQQQPVVSSRTKPLRQHSRGAPHSSGVGGSSSSSRHPGPPSPAARQPAFPVPGAPRFTSPATAQLCQRLCSCTSYQAVQQVMMAALEAAPQPQPPAAAPSREAGTATAVADTTTSTASATSGSSSVPPLAMLLDAATTAVLLPHLAHLGAATPPSFLEDAALQALLPTIYDLAQAHLPSLGGPAAQGALLALAQLKYVDAPALAALLEEARPGLGEWRLAGAAQLLVALARGQQRPSNAWLAAVMQEAQQQLSSASLHTLSGLLWGLVQLGVRPAPTWMRGFTAAAAEAATAAAGAAGVPGSSVPVHSRAPSSRSSTSGSSRSRRPEGAGPQQLQQPRADGVVPDVARLLSALAEARLAAAPALSSALLAAAGANLAAATPKAAVELLAAAGSLQLVPGDAWLAQYCSGTAPSVPIYSTWQLATSVLALGQLQEAMDAAAGGLQGLGSGGRSALGAAAGVGRAGGASLTFAVVFQQQLRQQQEAAAVAAGVDPLDQPRAPLPVPPARAREELCQQPVVGQWLQQLLAAAQQQVRRLAARELADLLRGLALLQRAPGQALMGALMAEVVNKLPRFTTAGLASVIDSSVALQQLMVGGARQSNTLTGEPRDPQPQTQQQQQQQQQVELLHQEWWAACLDAVLIKLPVLNIQEVRQVLVAVAAASAAAVTQGSMAHRDGAAEHQQQQQQQQAELQELLQPPSERWVAAVAGHAQGKLTLLPAEGLLQVAAALADLGHTPDPSWTAAWLAAAQRQLEAATPQQLLQVLSAARQQQTVALSGAWLSAAADAVANLQLQASWEQQLAAPGGSGGTGVSSELQECEQLLQAMRATIAEQAPAAVAATPHG